MSSWSQVGLLDPKTANAENLVLYHDLVLVVIGSVLVLVGWFLVIFLLQDFFFKGQLNRSVKSNEVLEVVWTTAPAIFLFCLGFVSLVNLYSMEVGANVVHSVEAHGHQWYWDYEYLVSLDFFDEGFCGQMEDCMVKVLDDSCEDSKFELEAFVFMFSGISGYWSVKSESYGILEEYLGHNVGLTSGFRNLDVTAPCYLAYGLKNEVKVSTSDVMHSWGVPELGVKADAIPGRVNSLGITPLVPGFSFGNCYELCGAGHSTMPITTFITSLSNVVSLLKSEVFNSEEVWDFFMEELFSEDSKFYF